MIKYEIVPIDETFPEYVREHEAELTAAGLIKEKVPKKSCEHCGRTHGEWVGRFCLKCLETCGPKALTQMHPRELAEVEREFNEPNEPKAEPSLSKKHWTVTASISTKDRYHTTLSLALSAVITQTRKPEKLKIYDDGEQLDLRTLSPYEGLLKMCDELGIEWEVIKTPRKGQVANHQHCLDAADTDFIWRVDDDEIPMPDCLEKLINTIRDYSHGEHGGNFETIGAVAGLVHHPGAVSTLLSGLVDGTMGDIGAGANMQWFSWNGGPREVEHLYSTFLYSVNAARKAGGYPKNLSVVGHREETILTHSMHRAGYKLLIQPHALTYHLRESTGGIRSFTDQSMWEHDEQIFQGYLKEWGEEDNSPTKLIYADMGRGDHFVLKSILPELRKRHPNKELILSVCFPEIFEGEGLKLISIATAQSMLGDRVDNANLYRFLWERNWQRPLAEGMLEFWG